MTEGNEIVLLLTKESRILLFDVTQHSSHLSIGTAQTGSYFWHVYLFRTESLFQLQVSIAPYTKRSYVHSHMIL
jgi:hypothetical protein